MPRGSGTVIGCARGAGYRAGTPSPDCRNPAVPPTGRSGAAAGFTKHAIALTLGPWQTHLKFLVQCATAEEADRALGLGFAVETSREVAAECGAPAPDDAESLDSLEDVLEAHLRPYGRRRRAGRRRGGPAASVSGGRRFGRRGGAASAADRSEAYYRKVADHLIDQIEAGTAPWTQAWQPGEKAMARNVATGKAYRGGNSVWLASVAQMRGYQDERWGTYKQVEGLGGQVRRGQKGAAILYWQFETRKLARDRNGRKVLDEEGKPVYETMPLERPRSYPYTVFNAEQCDGLPHREAAAGVPAWDSIEAAERVLKQSGAEIEHARQDRVYYDLGRDRIVLPLKEQFPTGPTYYQSALHELGHWTGHPDRLNRATPDGGDQGGLLLAPIRPGGDAGGD